jgi:hypothetical protein
MASTGIEKSTEAVEAIKAVEYHMMAVRMVQKENEKATVLVPSIPYKRCLKRSSQVAFNLHAAELAGMLAGTTGWAMDST